MATTGVRRASDRMEQAVRAQKKGPCRGRTSINQRFVPFKNTGLLPYRGTTKLFVALSFLFLAVLASPGLRSDLGVVQRWATPTRTKRTLLAFSFEPPLVNSYNVMYRHGAADFLSGFFSVAVPVVPVLEPSLLNWGSRYLYFSLSSSSTVRA